MLWQNLWALAGLSLLALPVVIHLLSRKRAVQQKFPSLRFLNVSRLLPTRSPNLSDIPLLIVRMAIVFFAAVALAQPLFVSAARRQSFNRSLARVIVVDTSRSMSSAMAGGKSAVDSARALAVGLSSEASSSVVLSTSSPSSVLAGAGAWLASQGGRGDIVVLSDFQTGALDSLSVATVPAQFGIRAVRVAGDAATNMNAVLNTLRTNVTASVDSARTNAEWTSASDLTPSVRLWAASAERADVEAVSDAASSVSSAGRGDSTKPVGIMFAGATEFASIGAGAKAPSAAWMSHVMLRVQGDALLTNAAIDVAATDTNIAAPFAVVTRNQSGAPVVYAAEASISGASQLVFVSRVRPATLVAAALIAAVSNAVAVPSALSESDPARLSDQVLSQFAREPKDVSAENAGGERDMSARQGLSDGRWFWLIALALLGLETWMRRKTQDNVEAELA